jgi:hypothetical protein
VHYNDQRPAVRETRINLAAAARQRAHPDAAIELTAAAANCDEVQGIIEPTPLDDEVEGVIEPTPLDEAAADTDVIAK